VVAGLSMGGALALQLLATEPGLAGGVLVNPSVNPRDPRLRALPVAKWLVPAVGGLGNDIAKPQADERPYHRVPLKALASLVEGQRDLRGQLHRVSQPLLVLTSAQDHAVDPADSRLVVERVASTDVEHVTLERSYHVATLDHDAELVADRTERFVRRVAGSPAGTGAGAGA
jgi:carboxylesterase